MQTVLTIRSSGPGLHEFTSEVVRFVREAGAGQGLLTLFVQHTTEGADDMPAHIKASLNAVSLSIPVTGGHPALGQWQGIYLFGHRRRAHSRRVVAHLSA